VLSNKLRSARAPLWQLSTAKARFARRAPSGARPGRTLTPIGGISASIETIGGYWKCLARLQCVRAGWFILLVCRDVDNRACISCGATGATVKITREHTFSNWINDVLTPAVVGPDITCERSIMHGSQAGVVNTWPATEVAGHKLRAVCRTCNNGWMSSVEGEVRPLIEPMIEGYNASLTTEQQITVATWATMKTAVFEYVWTDDPALTAADREVIMTQNRPPASAQVRLAAIESKGYPLRAFGRIYEVRGSGDKAICLTMTIGCLVVQVFGGPGAGTRGWQSAGRTGTDFIGIFPPQMRTVQWPPANVLDDASLQNFTHPLAALTDAPGPG
jgi:hypothetical protein